MIETHWSSDTLQLRIADFGGRRRHHGGSPDPDEIGAYATGLAGCSGGDAVVLGMTPELRALALRRFERVVCVDGNPDSIALYRDWIAPADRSRETTILGDWLELPRLIARPVSAVLADGVFGNLPNLGAHASLLTAIAAVLQPQGRFVTRTAMIPDEFNPVEHRAERLRAQFRAGELNEAEFGFAMRLVGHHELCYDPQTYLLNNARLFALCAARHAAGEFTSQEWQAINRYYYGGSNCILPQREWESTLLAGGWHFQLHRCRGRAWYDYYPVYACHRPALHAAP